MSREQESAAAVPPDPHVRRRRYPLLLLSVTLSALVASVACNVLLYKRAHSDYRSLSELQLDPYGLKHPKFPPDAAHDPGSEDLPVVVFFGDSRARQWPIPRVPGWRFVNRGVGGQTTEQLRGRFDAHVMSLSPRVVIVQGGINDLKSIPLLPGRRDEIVADCKANLRDLVRRSRDGGAVVIVTTIFSTGPVTLDRRAVWSADIETAVAEVNADLRGLEGEKVVVLDSQKLLNDGSRRRDAYAADTLHLTQRGYEVLNAELKKILTSLTRP